MVAKGNAGRRLPRPFVLSAGPHGLERQRGKRGAGEGPAGACTGATAQMRGRRVCGEGEQGLESGEGDGVGKGNKRSGKCGRTNTA